MVRCELDLIAVGTEHCWLRDDPSVVHQDVQSVVVEVLCDAFFDCTEGREVHLDEAKGYRWKLGFDVGDQSVGGRYIATGEVDVRRVVCSERAHALFAESRSAWQLVRSGLRGELVISAPPVTSMTLPERSGMCLVGLKSLKPCMLHSCIVRLGQHAECEHTAIYIHFKHHLDYIRADEQLLSV
jgi:hypothetical protein